MCNWVIGDECCGNEVEIRFSFVDIKSAEAKMHKSPLMETDRQDREAVLQNRQTGGELVRGRLMGRRDIMTTESG